MSTRFSFFLGVNDPSMTIDTGSSASLASVHNACQSLCDGEKVLKAMVILSTPHGLEYALNLNKRDSQIFIAPIRDSESSPSATYSAFFKLFIYSKHIGKPWEERGSGYVTIYHNAFPKKANRYYQAYAGAKNECDNPANPRQFYESIDAIGMNYGRLFRNVESLRGRGDICVGTIYILDTKSTMLGIFEYLHVIHPTTLDSVFETAFSFGNGPMAPSFLESLYISAIHNEESAKSVGNLLFWNREGQDFLAFQNVVCVVKGIFWITRGSRLEARNPQSCLAQTLGQSMQSEYSKKKLVLFNIDRDIMCGTIGEGNLGTDLYGVAEQIGETVTAVAPGDHVVGIARGPLRDFVTCHCRLLYKAPENLLRPHPLYLPTSFSISGYMLGKLKPENTILIHAAAGNFGQTAIQLAKSVGAVIFTGVETKHEHNILCHV
ncbi:hypothetical protein F5Y11DRAFT_364882 [Daldinia sp. FL1419]|nr:hypothetical protein F5Y11DRAFT_364882 [Daldinia sp. FL1419]